MRSDEELAIGSEYPARPPAASPAERRASASGPRGHRPCSLPHGRGSVNPEPWASCDPSAAAGRISSRAASVSERSAGPQALLAPSRSRLGESRTLGLMRSQRRPPAASPAERRASASGPRGHRPCSLPHGRGSVNPEPWASCDPSAAAGRISSRAASVSERSAGPQALLAPSRSRLGESRTVGLMRSQRGRRPHLQPSGERQRAVRGATGPARSLTVAAR